MPDTMSEPRNDLACAGRAGVILPHRILPPYRVFSAALWGPFALLTSQAHVKGDRADKAKAYAKEHTDW